MKAIIPANDKICVRKNQLWHWIQPGSRKMNHLHALKNALLIIADTIESPASSRAMLGAHLPSMKSHVQQQVVALYKNDLQDTIPLRWRYDGWQRLPLTVARTAPETPCKHRDSCSEARRGIVRLSLPVGLIMHVSADACEDDNYRRG